MHCCSSALEASPSTMAITMYSFGRVQFGRRYLFFNAVILAADCNITQSKWSRWSQKLEQ